MKTTNELKRKYASPQNRRLLYMNIHASTPVHLQALSFFAKTSPSPEEHQRLSDFWSSDSLFGKSSSPKPLIGIPSSSIEAKAPSETDIIADDEILLSFNRLEIKVMEETEDDLELLAISETEHPKEDLSDRAADRSCIPR